MNHGVVSYGGFFHGVNHGDVGYWPRPSLLSCCVTATGSMAVLKHTAVAAFTLMLLIALLKHDLDLCSRKTAVSKEA